MMNRIKRPTLLSAGMVTGLLALTVGCQSAQKTTAEASGIPKFIPPLYSSQGVGSAAETSHLTGAPSTDLKETTDLRTADQIPTHTVPPLPGEGPPLHHSPVQQVSAASPAGAMPALLPPVGSTSPTAASDVQWKSASASGDPNSCLPGDAQWRKQIEGQLDNQTQRLSKRLDEMEGELKTAQEQLQSVTSQLQASRGEIQTLQQEVTRWKGEVRRLEEEMRAQQLADLKSLDELTDTMHRLLLRQQQGTPAQGATATGIEGRPQ